MKKSIGARIYSILFILLLAFIGYSIISISGLKQSKNSIENLSSNYMEMQKYNEVISKNIAELRMYSNIMALSDNNTNGTALNETVHDIISETNVSLHKMMELVEGLNNSELVAALSTYDTQARKLEENVLTVADAYKSGEFRLASIQNNVVTSSATTLEGYQEIFTNTLTAAAMADANASSKSIDMVQTVALIVNVIIIGIEIIVMLIIRSSVIKPAKVATKHLNEIISGIEQGEGNLTDRLVVKSKDEIGQLSTGINAFIEQLQGIMIKLRNSSEGMDRQVTSINSNIATSEGSASDVSATMQQMSASIEEISATLDQITTGSQNMLENAQEMRDMADDGAGLVNEIKLKAQGIREDAIESKNDTIQMIENNKQMLEVAIENSRRVEKINELTNEIMNISSQTNLLSLNASIEAARAGDAGRGFAVVADEIRSLADSSKNTAENIQNISKMVTAAVTELASSANEMLTFIDTKILLDYDKLVDVSNQYHDDAESIDAMMSNFKMKTGDLENSISDINNGIGGINTAVDESAEGINMVADNTSQLVELLGNIKEEAENNRAISDELANEVQMFKHI